VQLWPELKDLQIFCCAMVCQRRTRC